MSCADLTAALVAAICGAQAMSGTEADLILMNYKDIDRDLSAADDDVITELIMKATKKGYKFTSLEDSTLGEFALVKGTFQDRWQHDVTGRIFTKDEMAKAFMNALGKKARVVAIVKNKEAGYSNQNTGTGKGSTKYEVYGWDSGLEVLEATGSTEIADGVVYQFKAGSPEKSKEGSIPKSFYDGVSLATTEQAITSLLGGA